MGQFALGIRSLVVRATIFVIMAALLAWALGGTLFPRAQKADFSAQAVRFGDDKWFWQVQVGGKNPGEVRWNLMNEHLDGKVSVYLETPYVEVAGPVLCDDGLYYAGRDRNNKRKWEMVRIDAKGKKDIWLMRDRLAVEQQLERLRSGLPLQDFKTIEEQRVRVLDPSGNSADE